jgi:transglutaminase-like putative cysteine protease
MVKGMKVVPKILYLLCFIGLAATAALALNRSVQPSMSDILLRTVIAASLAGAPGLIHRKAWPAALVLLPLGAYLLLRTTLPLPDVLKGLGEQYGFYAETLREGGAAYLDDIFPLQIGDVPGLRLLTAVSVYVVVGAASFLALSMRKAVPALVCLMVLLGFSLTVDGASRELWLAVLFMILAACLLVLSRALARSGWRLRDALAGGLVGGVAALLAVILLGAAPSAVAVPWQDWRTWDPFRQGGSVYTFNWMQNYPRLLDPANDQLIMRVQSSSPSYWRANALDVFTGTAWVTSQAFPVRPEPVQDADTGVWVYRLPTDGPVPTGKSVTEVFQIQSVYTNYMFAGGEPIDLHIDQRIALRLNDMRSLHVSRSLGPRLEYSLDAVIPDLEPKDIIDKGNDYPRSVSAYLSLPFPRISELEGPDKEAAWRELTQLEAEPAGWEWADLYSANRQIVGDATDPYEITLRIEKHLRSHYDYSLAPPASDYSSPYAAFLFDTQSGYCQHFAGTMALLLRYNGVPARVAVGFTTGEKESEGVYLVSTSNAHAWVEVYFPTVGWVAFDPTPGRSIPAPGPSSSSPGFINPFNESTGDDNSPITTEPRLERNVNQPGGARESGAGSAAWYGPAWLLWLLGLLVVAAAWPVARYLWKHRDLRRGALDNRLATSLRLLQQELSGYGLATSPAATIEDILLFVEVDLKIPVGTDLIDRFQAVLFGDREATAADLERAEAIRRDARIRLRRRYGWIRTGLTWYGLSHRASLQGTGA